MTNVHCSGVGCRKNWPVATDGLWQLDRPGHRFLVFCGLGCLRTWVIWESTVIDPATIFVDPAVA